MRKSRCLSGCKHQHSSIIQLAVCTSKRHYATCALAHNTHTHTQTRPRASSQVTHARTYNVIISILDIPVPRRRARHIELRRARRSVDARCVPQARSCTRSPRAALVRVRSCARVCVHARKVVCVRSHGWFLCLWFCTAARQSTDSMQHCGTSLSLCLFVCAMCVHLLLAFTFA